jgi:hypothetical protein
VAVNVTRRSTPAQRSDRWTFRHLGVRSDVAARNVAAERALAFQGKISLLNRFSNAIFLKF